MAWSAETSAYYKARERRKSSKHTAAVTHVCAVLRVLVVGDALLGGPVRDVRVGSLDQLRLGLVRARQGRRRGLRVRATLCRVHMSAKHVGTFASKSLDTTGTAKNTNCSQPVAMKAEIKLCRLLGPARPVQC